MTVKPTNKRIVTSEMLYEVAAKKGALVCPFCGKNLKEDSSKCGNCLAEVDLAKLSPNQEG